MQVEKDWRAFGHKFYTRCQQAGSVRQTVLSHVHMPTNSRLILHAASNQFCFAHHTQTATRVINDNDESFAPRCVQDFNSSESSPIFLQWLDVVYQIMRQFPERNTFVLSQLRLSK